MKKTSVRFRKRILDTEVKRKQFRWVITIATVSFFISVLMTLISDGIMKITNNVIIALFVLLAIIIIGIVFDIIGTAIVSSDSKPLYAMASRKVYGAKLAIKLLRNADKMSSICNDIIGDICSVISGTAVAFIALQLSGENDVWVNTVATLALTGLVSSLFVGGKSFGKTIAIKESDEIVYKFAVVVSFVTFVRRESFPKRINHELSDTKKNTYKK